MLAGSGFVGATSASAQVVNSSCNLSNVVKVDYNNVWVAGFAVRQGLLFFSCLVEFFGGTCLVQVLP